METAIQICVAFWLSYYSFKIIGSYRLSYQRMKAGQPNAADLLRYTGMTDLPKVNETYGEPNQEAVYSIEKEKIPTACHGFLLTVAAHVLCISLCLSGSVFLLSGGTQISRYLLTLGFLVHAIPFAYLTLVFAPRAAFSLRGTGYYD